jgi:hypothetical protein
MPLNAMRRVESLLPRMLRDLKPSRIIAEVAKGDRPSYFRNFKGYRIEKFGRPKLGKLARKEMFERKNEFWAQLIIVLWNEAHRELYIAFRDRVATINEDVEEVERIEDDVAETWVEEMLKDHVLEDILICVHLNEVRMTDAFVRSRLEEPLDIKRDADDLAHNGEAEIEAVERRAKEKAEAPAEADDEAAPAEAAAPAAE